MFILLVSDTHGNISEFRRVLSNYSNLDMVIHLGDYAKDVVKMQKEFSNIMFEYVPGNNDWSCQEPNDKILDLCGKRVFITHGHKYRVKSGVDSLTKKAKEQHVDAAFFGHTHLADEFSQDGILYANPGSLGLKSLYQGSTFIEAKIDQDISLKFRGLP